VLLLAHLLPLGAESSDLYWLPYAGAYYAQPYLPDAMHCLLFKQRCKLCYNSSVVVFSPLNGDGARMKSDLAVLPICGARREWHNSGEP